jgi:hypothetical protein
VSGILRAILEPGVHKNESTTEEVRRVFNATTEEVRRVFNAIFDPESLKRRGTVMTGAFGQDQQIPPRTSGQFEPQTPEEMQRDKDEIKIKKHEEKINSLFKKMLMANPIDRNGNGIPDSLELEVRREAKGIANLTRQDPDQILAEIAEQLQVRKQRDAEKRLQLRQNLRAFNLEGQRLGAFGGY